MSESDRSLLSLSVAILAFASLMLVAASCVLWENNKRLRALEEWRADCLKRGELVWFSPDGPKRVKVSDVR